jgi:fructose-bisphosphate aldolase class I
MGNKGELQATANALVAEGKGILAADESTGTITRRLNAVGVESTFEMRRAYRDMLLTTSGIEAFISGVILYDETIRQESLEGIPFPKLLQDKGIIPGIKVDMGAKELAGFPGEQVTEGLDGLRERLAEYHHMGARFAKWRAVITIGPGIPTRFCLHANAHALARYAALCQEAGLVPIVEPEVLMNGDHTIARCAETTEATLAEVFASLHEHRVAPEALLLKPNMVLPALNCPEQVGAKEVATATLSTLKRTVPAAVPGIVFLSGGQSAELATERLNAMNNMGPQPWEVSFSFARALQGPAMDAWRGQKDKVSLAQKLFYYRARCNSAARSGRYVPSMEASAPTAP